MRKKLNESNFYRKVRNKCKDCLRKKLKCEFCEEFLTKNGCLVILSENNKRANINQKSIMFKKYILPEKQKHDNNLSFSTNQNHSHVIVGPRNVGKTFYMLNILGKKQQTTYSYNNQINIQITKQVLKLNQ